MIVCLAHSHYVTQVTINRKVLRCIDTYELVLNLMKMTDPEFKAIMTALVVSSPWPPFIYIDCVINTADLFDIVHCSV